MRHKYRLAAGVVTGCGSVIVITTMMFVHGPVLRFAGMAFGGIMAVVGAWESGKGAKWN